MMLFGVAVKFMLVADPEQMVVVPEIAAVKGGRTVITRASLTLGQVPSARAVIVSVTEPPAVEIPVGIV